MYNFVFIILFRGKVFLTIVSWKKKLVLTSQNYNKN